MLQPKKLLAATAVLLIAQGVLQKAIDPLWKKHYSTGGETLTAGLGPEQILVALSGFREVLAGILWVRADEFFHSGNYDAILPLVRLVTLLDPHQIDVYVTGAWHMGYNFTDEDQRSDRRYLEPALEILREGVANNPHTYELWFEYGWTNYHKVQDFPEAVMAFEKANAVSELADTPEENKIPIARRNILAHAYEKNGQIWEAFDYYKKLHKLNQDILDEYPESDSARVGRDTIENELDNHIVRMAARGYYAMKRGQYNAAGHYATFPPREQMDFGVRITVPEPAVIKVVGRLGLMPIGARVQVVLKDKGYNLDLRKKGFSFEVAKDVTYMQDSLFNRKARFSSTINMTKDPSMYPFLANEYDLEFLWSPRWAPAYIQDRLGWNGEGMDDKKFLDTSVPNLRQIFCRLNLTRDQILRQGQWRDKTPVIETSGFVEPIEAAPRYKYVTPVAPSASPGAATGAIKR